MINFDIGLSDALIELNDSNLLRCSIVIGNIFDSFGHVLNVSCGQSSDWDSSTFHQVNVMLFNHHFALFCCEAGEAKHTNLVCNVIPCALRSELFEILLKELSHLSDSYCHIHKFTEPLLSHVFVV